MPWFTKKRKKNASFSFSGHIQGRFRPFQACFGLFRPFSGLFRPYRPPADTTRYGPILAKSTRVGANRSPFGTNRAASAWIWEKKKTDAVRRAGNRVERGCSTSGAASVLSSFQLGPHKALVPMASLPSSIRNIGLLSKQISSKLSKPFFIQFLPSNLLTILTSHLSLKILSLMMLHILGPSVYVMWHTKSFPRSLLVD